LGAQNLEQVKIENGNEEKNNHLSLVDNNITSEESSNFKITFLSALFTITLSITAIKLMNTAYYTLKSMYSADVYVAMAITFNEVYQNVVFSAYCFEIGLSFIFSFLYAYNFYSALKRKKSMKKIFLATQGSYLLVVTTYNCMVWLLLGSKIQMSLIISNLMYLGLWYSYLKYNQKAQLVFVEK